MKIKQKYAIVTIVLFTVLCLGIWVMTSDIAYERKAVTSGNYNGTHWKYDKLKKALIFYGKGKMYDYTGEEDECDLPWWKYSNVTKTIVIGEGITHIGDFAFGSFPFDDFAVTYVSIPDSVTSIGDSAFSGCKKLKNIKLPKGLIKLDSAFCGCKNLKKIVIPDGVKSMGKWTFSDCDQLSSVILPNNLKMIPEGTFRNCPKLKSIKIPDSVIKISANAFENSGIRSITIPQNVTILKDEIFLDCKYLKTITIKSSNITNIRRHAFTGVSKKTVIKVPKEMLEIYKKRFYTKLNMVSADEDMITSGKYHGVKWNYDETTCILTITGNGKIKDTLLWEKYPWDEFVFDSEDIIIGEGITHIGDDAFDDFLATSVSLPKSIKSIGWSAFGCCHIESILLPDGLRKIDPEAFISTDLIEVGIPNSVISIGDAAFSCCDDLTRVTLPRNLKKLPRRIFSDCSKLKSIKIPENVTTIGDYAFQYSGIKSIIIPKNVTTLKNYIFDTCNNLKIITVQSGKIRHISKNTFKGIDEKTVIKVPKQKLRRYKLMFYKSGLSKKVIITTFQ